MTKNNTLYSHSYSYLLFTLYQSNQDEKVEEIVENVENRAELLETEKEQLKEVKTNDGLTVNESLFLDTPSSGRFGWISFNDLTNPPWI